MDGSKQIPTLKTERMDRFHFGEVPWKFRHPSQHHLFHINRIEDYLDKISFPLPPHRKTVCDFLFLTEGKTVRSKGLNQYVIESNQFFFLPALQITSHESMSSDIKGYFVHFSPDLFADYPHILSTFPFLKFLADPIVSIPSDQITPIINILQRMHAIYEDLKKEDLPMVGWYLLALLTEVKQFAPTAINLSKMNAAAQLTARYKDALTEHIYQKQGVQEYAEFLNVTPNHLNKCIKSTLNQTAQSLLNEMLVLEAKSLLKYSGLPISQIAEKLCGQTPSNFSRFFKNQTGLSPKQFLELHTSQ